MNYAVYVLTSLALMGTWLLGLALPVGKGGVVLVTVVTMGLLVALIIHYEETENE